jgi:hypothetical protein
MLRNSHAISLASFALAALTGCAAAQGHTSQAKSTGTNPADGLEFELLVPRTQAFQLALVTLVQFGIPIADASESAGTINSGRYQFNAQTEASYSIVVSGSDRVSRVVITGRFRAPSLGITSEPITQVEYGFRANIWKHFAGLAQGIETQRLSVVIPEENIHRSPP